MDNKFEPLSGGEVLSVNDSVQFLIGHTTFRAEELAQALRTQLLEHSIGGLTEAKKHWLTEHGIDCEVLRFGAEGWQKGKVRISLEFCPLDGEAEGLEESAIDDTEDDFSVFEEDDDSDLEELALDNDAPTIIETGLTSESDLDFGEALEEDEPVLDLGKEPEVETESELDFGEALEEDEPVLDLGKEPEVETESDLDFGEALEEDEPILDLGKEPEVETESELDFGEALEEDEPVLDLEEEPEVEAESDLDFGEALEEDEPVLDLGEEPEVEAESELDFGEALDEDEPALDLGDTSDEEEAIPIALGGESQEEMDPELVDLGNDIFGQEDQSLDLNGQLNSDSDLDLGSSEEDLDLAELENSIEEELELVEASEKDEEFDLAEMGQDSEDLDIALSGEEEKGKEKEEDNLFDDVWQDIN